MKRVLVVLDNPHAATIVMPAALEMLRGGCRQLTLLSVCRASIPWLAVYTDPERMREASRSCAQSWLHQALEQVPFDVAVDCHVSVSAPITAVRSILRGGDHRLVVMSRGSTRLLSRRRGRALIRVCRRYGVQLAVVAQAASGELTCLSVGRRPASLGETG